jgi:restriction system protein
MIKNVNFFSTYCKLCGKNKDVYAVGGEFVCYSCLTKPKEREERADRVAVIQQLMKEIPPDKVKPRPFYEVQSLATLRIWLKMEHAKRGHSPMLQESFECSQLASEAITAMENILASSLGRSPASNKQRGTKYYMKLRYTLKESEAVSEYFKHALSSSDYPSDFPRTFQIDYNPETCMLIVDYSLPNINLMPKIREVKYVKSKNELVEVPLAESTVNKMYDSVVYQITLRTLHELFESDVDSVIEAIILNGWVESIDTATGKNVNRCIISIQTNRQEFSQIDLARVDPKACFKKLKGIGSSALHSWTAIAPIVNINREDKRFVQAYEVANDLEESFNLAGMPWEDFEHLVRELFEKEFSQDGGGVNITRTSRDGGIDAIAFDPDPIRGGKIAIQAKCYTNTVGVDAVRDLYGTVINEGANKGILVTTSDYGADAYEFAKGKPLTLMNGSNLLYLLEKHGYKAKIDLKAAKQTKSNRESTKQ